MSEGTYSTGAPVTRNWGAPDEAGISTPPNPVTTKPQGGLAETGEERVSRPSDGLTPQASAEVGDVIDDVREARSFTPERGNFEEVGNSKLPPSAGDSWIE